MQLLLTESLFVQESPEHLRELRIPIVVLDSLSPLNRSATEIARNDLSDPPTCDRKRNCGPSWNEFLIFLYLEELMDQSRSGKISFWMGELGLVRARPLLGVLAAEVDHRRGLFMSNNRTVGQDQQTALCSDQDDVGDALVTRCAISANVRLGSREWHLSNGN